MTYETFKPCPLPQRLNFVLTRDPAYSVAESVIVCTSLADVLAYNHKKLFVLGGAQVYQQALPLADEMILTHVPIQVEGDAYFPTWAEEEWVTTSQREEDELIFTTYRRKLANPTTLTHI